MIATGKTMALVLLCCVAAGTICGGEGGGTTIPVHMVRASAASYICSSSPVIVISHSAHTLLHVHLSRARTHAYTHSHTHKYTARLTDTARYGCILIYEGKMRLDEQLSYWCVHTFPNPTPNFEKCCAQNRTFAHLWAILFFNQNRNSSKIF